jgi:chromosome partitioning protein
MQLTLFEREVSKESLHGRLRSSIGNLLGNVRGVFDVVFIDCPPGLSVLTESWLREADFHFSPTKPDYVSTCGLEVFRRFKGLNPEMGFAENIGVCVNMKDGHSSVDEDYHRWLLANRDNRCFSQPVPRTSALQHASQLSAVERSYAAKYPGQAGRGQCAGRHDLRVDQRPALARACPQDHRLRASRFTRSRRPIPARAPWNR